MALKHIMKMDLCFKTEMLHEVSDYVSRASGRELPPWKAIVGANMFAHESGIHADGMMNES